MKKLINLLIALAVTGVFVIGLFQFVPDLKPNVGWNSRPIASAESVKPPAYFQPNVGWNS